MAADSADEVKQIEEEYEVRLLTTYDILQMRTHENYNRYG